MIRKAVVPAIAVLSLAACATPSDTGEPIERGDMATCDADAVQDRVGERATTELGARLLAATGAETLRWAPPRSAMTMDYRPDRLTISYDDNMTIDRISCG